MVAAERWPRTTAREDVRTVIWGWCMLVGVAELGSDVDGAGRSERTVELLMAIVNKFWDFKGGWNAPRF